MRNHIYRIVLLLAMLLPVCFIATDTQSAPPVADNETIIVTFTAIVAPELTNDGATEVTGDSAVLNGTVDSTGNDNPVVTAFMGESDGGTDPASWSENYSLGALGLGAFEYEWEDLDALTTYYFTFRGVNAEATVWTSSANFTTSAQVPDAVSVFTVWELGANTISCNWTASENTTGYMVRIKRDSAPTGPTDGEEFYYGPLTSANKTGFSLGPTPYILAVYPYNETGYGDGVTGTIGGEYVMAIAVMIVVMGISVLVFLKDKPMLYVVGIIAWLFATGYLINMTYPSGNTYLAYAAGGLGFAMVLVMGVMVYLSTRPDHTTRSTYRDRRTAKLEDIRKRATRPKRPWWV